MRLNPETRNETITGDVTETTWHDARDSQVHQILSDSNDLGRNRIWCRVFCTELQRSI